MQPAVSYQVRAVVKCSAGSDGNSKELKDVRAIPLMPFTEKKPPLEMNDYPMEFKPVSRRKLSSWFGGSIAEMALSMEEPPALHYAGHTSRTSSEGLLRLVLVPPENAATFRPLDWTCTIESQLHIKTYYSTHPLPRIPSRPLITSLGPVRLRSERIELGSCTRKISWRLGMKPKDDESLQSSRTLTWTADLPLPLETSGNLLPNFCSPLVARSYAVTVGLKIKALRHAMFELEVPVQVVNPDPDRDGDAGQGQAWEQTEFPGSPNFSPFEGLEVCRTLWLK